MTLRNARILSSCNDASNKQEQKMNVNIRVEDKTISPPAYPTVPPIQQQQQMYTQPQGVPVNFTTQEPTTPEMSQYASVAPTPSGRVSLERASPITRDINMNSIEKDLQIQDLETKNKFLNLLLTVYQNNPIYINSYVICDAHLLMEMIKLLTNCDKVDLVLNDDLACGGCTSDDKLIYVSKILVTKGDETKDLKYGYNDIYSKLIAYGISMKVVC